MDDRESGFISEIDDICLTDSRFTDVEVLRRTSVNVIARGRRYGRYWLLKALRPELADSPTYRRQLLKEFNIQSRVCDPWVAQVVSIEDVDSLGKCIVSEWIDGLTLGEALEAGKLDRSERRRIVRALVSVAARLHSMGIVHRDLKPANIMIRRDSGRVALIDFGLADTADYAELKTGAGTTGYISPEQADSQPASPADDIYSLGVIINALCPEYRRIARRCMASPDRRPANGDALLRLLDNSHRRRRYAVRALTVAAIGAALGFSLLRFYRLRSETIRSQAIVQELTDSNRNEVERRRALAVRADRLDDSLTRVNARLNESEAYRRNTRALALVKNQAVDDGYAQIDRLIERYDSDYISHYGPDDYVAYFQRTREMADESAKIADEAADALKDKNLEPAEIENVRTLINEYFVRTFERRNRVWQQRILPGN